MTQRPVPFAHRAQVQAREPSPEPEGGFTLLEVLVALTILGLAVVTLIQLSSQSLRLVKTSGDYQQAAQLADRLATGTQPSEEGVESGQEGPFVWERQVSLVPVPEELQPKETVPDKEPPKLFAVTIAVRWGQNQVFQLATLHTPTTSPAATQTTAAGGPQPTGPGIVSPITPSAQQPQQPMRR